MPWDHELCAAFYVGSGPVEDRPPRLALLGVSEAELGPGSGTFVGGWAGLDVEVRDRELAVLRSFVVAFVEPVLPRRRAVLLRREFWSRLAEAFRAACTALQPAAAFLTDVAEPDVDGVVADREQWVVAANPVPLLHEGFALLYLSDAAFPDLEVALEGLPHERTSLPGGILLTPAAGD